MDRKRTIARFYHHSILLNCAKTNLNEYSQKAKHCQKKNHLVPTLFVEMLVVLFVGNFAFFPFRHDLAAKWNPFLMLFFCARVHHCEKKFQVCKDHKYFNYQRRKKIFQLRLSYSNCYTLINFTFMIINNFETSHLSF